MAGEMPIGVQDFKKMREREYFYVDKSDMIAKILSDKAEAYLYTRPRRFGKSLNLSMLDAFFNLRYPKDNTWFDGLKVSGYEECQKHKNAYPVIYFDFKELSVVDTNTFYKDMVDKMSDLYRVHKYLLDSDILDDVDKSYFEDVFNRRLEPTRLRKSISTLSRMLYEHHGVKVIILLDEYDNPINNAFGKPFQQDIIDTMRGLLSSALKGNESLMFGVITGIMQIAKESIFSGLNNLEVNNILSVEYDEMFGFTDDEVRTICEDYGHPEKYPEAKEWYDGYRFGDTDVYNPWSIIKYVKSGFKPQTYWAGTSGNDILDKLLDRATPDMWDEFRLLAEGKPMQYRVKPTVTFQDLHVNERNIYSLLVMSGYLTAGTDDGMPCVSIPNGEMAHVFGEWILGRVHDDSQSYVDKLAGALIRGDTEEVSRQLYELFASSAGIAMLDNEHSYQAFLTGMLMYLHGRYSVKADFEGGNGRYDIRLERNRGDYPNIVIELKRIHIDSSDEHALSIAEKALEQIGDRDYTHSLTGDTLLYGIAFRNKKPTIVSKRIGL